MSWFKKFIKFITPLSSDELPNPLKQKEDVVETELVRARDKKGQYVADNISTPDVNEAYTTVKKKRGRPRKKPEPKVQVQRPVDSSPHNSHLKWDGKTTDQVNFDGRFSSVEPLKSQKAGRKGPYKWNHRALTNWIMGQAAKTLLGKCVPDLKAVEINQTVEERKIIDISRLSNDDLTTIERVLEHAVVDGDPSGEITEIPEAVHSGLLESNRART